MRSVRRIQTGRFVAPSASWIACVASEALVCCSAPSACGSPRRWKRKRTSACSATMSEVEASHRAWRFAWPRTVWWRASSVAPKRHPAPAVAETFTMSVDTEKPSADALSAGPKSLETAANVPAVSAASTTPPGDASMRASRAASQPGRASSQRSIAAPSSVVSPARSGMASRKGFERPALPKSTIQKAVMKR